MRTITVLTVLVMVVASFVVATEIILIFFVGLFLAVSPEKYRDGVVQLIPKAKRDRASEVLDSTSETLWRWLIGRFGSMLATGVGAFLLLLSLCSSDSSERQSHHRCLLLRKRSCRWCTSRTVWKRIE